MTFREPHRCGKRSFPFGSCLTCLCASLSPFAGNCLQEAGSAGTVWAKGLWQGWGQGIALAVGCSGCTSPGTGLCTVTGPVLAGEPVVQQLAPPFLVDALWGNSE